jgi:hypothetical protein
VANQALDIVTLKELATHAQDSRRILVLVEPVERTSANLSPVEQRSSACVNCGRRMR